MVDVRKPVTGLGPQPRECVPLSKQDGKEDMMTYVLIVVSWLGGAVNGAVSIDPGIYGRRAVRSSPARAN